MFKLFEKLARKKKSAETEKKQEPGPGDRVKIIGSGAEGEISYFDQSTKQYFITFGKEGGTIAFDREQFEVLDKQNEK